MKRKTLLARATLLWLCAGAAAAWGQDSASKTLTYTCTNAKGRNITSDRPIAECRDRVQRVLNSNGLEVRRLGPTLTDHELAEMEAARRQMEADRAREREERARAPRRLSASSKWPLWRASASRSCATAAGTSRRASRNGPTRTKSRFH